MNVERLARVGRAFMCLWVLFAVPTAVSQWQTAPDIPGILGFVVWGVAWIWFWTRGLGHGRPAEITGLVANTLILTLFALFSPQATVSVGGILVFSFIIAGVSFPFRTAIFVIAGLTVLEMSVSFLRHDSLSNAASGILNSVLVGGIGIGGRLLWESYSQLLAAREQLAQLAVTEERLRFARDVHDLLGQNLSVLVLKSELVSKQLPDGTDETLRQEVRDIAQVARKSLDDVREAVGGYRQATLQAEISSARTALRAAGIGLVVEDTLGPLAPAQDGVLAWCLREAVTNVVKHSGASRCQVRLSRSNGSARLDVSDDGRGATSLDGGNGLMGMRERVELVGGSLEVGSENRGGLRLHVSVPSRA